MSLASVCRMATTFPVRFPPDSKIEDALRETAEREGRSMNAVAVEAIARYTSERTRRRDAIIARVLEKDKELLDRLA